MMTYTDSVRKLLDAMQEPRQSLNMIVRRAAIPRPKIISLLARLIRFNVVRWEYADQQFLFSL
jgi:DNA-binding IclR family transcriptional regulator